MMQPNCSFVVDRGASRLAWPGLFAALVVGSVLSAACQFSAPGHGDAWPAATGMPRAPGRAIHVLKNRGFVVGYDTVRQRAAWVAFRLTAVDRHHSMPRPTFRADPRLTKRDEPAVYAGPAFDRGHLAPNYAISRLYGERAQQQTFYYSNITPQAPRLNQLVWQRLEEIEIDELAPRVDTLWVVTGPIPEDAGPAPVAFYRIWLARGSSGQWRVLAFRVPQTVRGDERLDRFIVSVDTLEAATGIDFFAALSPDRQDRLESVPGPPDTFGFAAHACDRARYGGRWQDRDGIHLDYDRC